jgi:hypothetical protein
MKRNASFASTIAIAMREKRKKKYSIQLKMFDMHKNSRSF